MIGSEPVDLKTPSKAKSTGTSVTQRAIHNPQNLPNLRSAMLTPARHTPAHLPSQYAPIQSDMYRGQILGVRNLRGQVLSPTRSIGVPATPTITPCAPSYAKVGCELGPSNDKSRDSDRYYWPGKVHSYSFKRKITTALPSKTLFVGTLVFTNVLHDT